MQVETSSENVINTLKNCIQWKNDESIKATKFPLGIFIDFIKLRLLKKHDSAVKVFHDFYNNPQNLKVEGKLETWVEISIEESPGLGEEINKKIEKVEGFYKQWLAEQKQTEEVLEPATEQKPIEKEYEIDENKVDKVPDTQRPILVPWDFSSVAQFALDHAVLFAKTTGSEVYLLHLTKHDKDIDLATTDLNLVAKNTFSNYKIMPKVLVQTGNISKTITQIANDNNAKFVIMGTHGIKGIQKFTGSLALKVIAGTNTPFIVVQGSPTEATIKNVIFPVDHTKENKQKLKQAKLLASHYRNVKFYLTMPEKITNEQVSRNLKTNLSYVKSYFRQNNIDFEVRKVTGASSFSDSTLKFAKETNPDMIIVLTTKNINIQDYVLGAEEQKIIANDLKIPVMCVNPMKVKFSSMSVHGVS